MTKNEEGMASTPGNEQDGVAPFENTFDDEQKTATRINHQKKNRFVDFEIAAAVQKLT